MPRTINLSEKIEQLRSFYVVEKRNPTFSELAKLFNYRSKNAVYGPLQKLIQLGYIEQNRSGRLTLTSKITGSSRLLGTVQAGFPSPAEEELIDTINLDQYLVRNPEATYLLTVSGDSMIDAGIQPGDIILVEKGGAPKKNDIVIAQVDGEWTMKYFGKDRQGVYLDPANSNYKRIRPDQSLTIGGIVKAVVRKYN
ncbi:MAG: LexA family transcriptional repressor [Kiritimatiellaceae bacterium]|jgi:SOS regulatory protein LexA|nr:LexA family transcriptional repressor [Kiritimatiellaceae bacterium]MAW40723.1 LexA family transcriptional repressor [Kiritimatiellaceae bacterium]